MNSEQSKNVTKGQKANDSSMALKIIFLKQNKNHQKILLKKGKKKMNVHCAQHR